MGEEVEQEVVNRRPGKGFGSRRRWKELAAAAAATWLVALALARGKGLRLAVLDPGERGNEHPAVQLKLHKISGLSKGLCNDGSDPAFYHRRGKPGGEGKWLVMLEGGGQCSSESSCERRPFKQKSTRKDPEVIWKEGVFAAAPGNAIGDFNAVYIRYCSSDGWHGDMVDPFPNTTEPEDLRFFQGTHVIDAVFETLRNPPAELPLDPMRPDDVVVFGGFSAGARGAMVNADRVRRTFGLTNMTAFLDSPYYVDLGDNFLVGQTKGVYELFVRGSPMAAANGVSSWRDLFGEYRMPQIESRFMLVASQWDSFQLHQAIDPFAFVHRTRQKLADLRPKDPCSIVFSGAQYVHAATGTPLFYSQGFDGKRLDHLLNDLVAGRNACDGGGSNTFIHPHGEACTGRGTKPPRFGPQCMPATWFALTGGTQDLNPFEGQPNTACSSSAGVDGSWGSSRAGADGRWGSLAPSLWTETFEECQAKCQATSECSGFQFTHSSGWCKLWEELIASRSPSRWSSCFRKTRFRFRGEPGTSCVAAAKEGRDPFSVHVGTDLAACKTLCASRIGCVAAEFVPDEQACRLWRVQVSTQAHEGGQACAVKSAVGWTSEVGTACAGTGPSREVAASSWGACLEQCLVDLDCHGVQFEADAQRCLLRLKGGLEVGQPQPGTSCARLLEVQGFRGDPGTECIAGADSEAYVEGKDYSAHKAPHVHACLDLCRAQKRCKGVDFRAGQCRLFSRPIVSSQAVADAGSACLYREPALQGLPVARQAAGGKPQAGG